MSNGKLWQNVVSTAKRCLLRVRGKFALKDIRFAIPANPRPTPIALPWVLCGCLVGLSSVPVLAADIAWVSFHPGNTMPSAAAGTAGFTAAPDKGYTDLLTSAGHNVTRIVTSAAPNVANLNTFDLVMISRSNPSGNFQTAASTAAWASVTAPMIQLGGYAIRANRMGYTTGDTIPDTSGPVRLTINAPNHPIFQGVARDANNVMTSDYSDDVLAPFDPFNLQRGISVNTNPLPAGATLLASLPDLTAGSPGMVIGQFPAGTRLSNATMDVQRGHRLVFLTGSRENDGLTSEGSGIFDLSPTGATMLRNAVNYMVGLGTVIPGDVNSNGVVDINDYAIIRDNFNGTGKTKATGDANGDTVVNFLDFRVWKNNRTDDGVGASLDLERALGQNVPEPSSLALALLGVAMLARATARRRG
jgi:hypothetical protein